MVIETFDNWDIWLLRHLVIEIFGLWDIWSLIILYEDIWSMSHQIVQVKSPKADRKSLWDTHKKSSFFMRFEIQVAFRSNVHLERASWKLTVVLLIVLCAFHKYVIDELGLWLKSKQDHQRLPLMPFTRGVCLKFVLKNMYPILMESFKRLKS